MGTRLLHRTGKIVIRMFGGQMLCPPALPREEMPPHSVYEVDGRQFVVIACGGGKTGVPSGGSYVAFALPK